MIIDSLKANSNAKKEKQSLPSIRKETWCVALNLVHVFSKAKNWRFAEVIKIYPKNSRSLLIVGIFVHRAGWCCKEADTLEKDLQSKNKTVFLS